jgi:hypothetical protein
MTRRARLLITGVVLALLLYPVAIDRDSHPLSTYPMYARTRAQESTIATAVGVSDDGERRPLTPTLIGDSDDPLVVVGQLRADISAGRADERCATIARRVAGRDDLDIGTIEVVTERHDTVARVLGEPSLLDRDVHASCEVVGA